MIIDEIMSKELVQKHKEKKKRGGKAGVSSSCSCCNLWILVKVRGMKMGLFQE